MRVKKQKKMKDKKNEKMTTRKSVSSLSFSLSLSLSLSFAFFSSLSANPSQSMLQRHVGKHEAAIERLNRVAGGRSGSIFLLEKLSIIRI